jgi:PilZ domain-containing protein
MDWFSIRRESKRGHAAMRPRATRFPVRTEVQFRRANEAHWRRGTTENMSCTGLLLQAEQALEPSTPVVVEVSAPPPLCGDARVRWFCEGRVVRSALDGPQGKPLMAVAIRSIRVPGYERSTEPVNPDNRSLVQLRAVVHDLNQQLAVVVGNADLLLTSPGLDTAVVNRLREVKRAAMLAASTVHKLPI